MPDFDMFSPKQVSTLNSAIDRIIPPDEWPGAVDADCADYIVNILTGETPALVATYRAGLDSLDAEAIARYETAFSALAATDQDEILHRVEAGDVRTAWNVDAKFFFSVLVNHTAEGYYADPAQGGNRDAKSWVMIGFDTGQTFNLGSARA